jgi:succinate dehydrogenase/fumarate reductase flavoprotein subunit
MDSAAQVVVIGGGLAGLSAAHTALEKGCSVVLLDKEKFLGGNSTRATSGINGALTQAQRSLGIADSPQVFEDDTLKGACGIGHSSPPPYTPPLAHVLTHDSGPAVDWLTHKFGLDLSKVSRLGGHSQVWRRLSVHQLTHTDTHASRRYAITSRGRTGAPPASPASPSPTR